MVIGRFFTDVSPLRKTPRSQTAFLIRLLATWFLRYHYTLLLANSRSVLEIDAIGIFMVLALKCSTA